MISKVSSVDHTLIPLEPEFMGTLLAQGKEITEKVKSIYQIPLKIEDSQEMNNPEITELDYILHLKKKKKRPDWTGQTGEVTCTQGD